MNMTSIVKKAAPKKAKKTKKNVTRKVVDRRPCYRYCQDCGCPADKIDVGFYACPICGWESC